MTHCYHHHHFMIIKMLWWRMTSGTIQGELGSLPKWRTPHLIGQVLMIQGESLIRSAIGILPARFTLHLRCPSLCTSTAHAD
eukprot:4067473-Amphidinium_carterae.1